VSGQASVYHVNFENRLLNTNLFDKKGVSTAVVTGNSGGDQAFPLAPRMGFVTLSADF
jgi:hypothetical protein